MSIIKNKLLTTVLAFLASLHVEAQQLQASLSHYSTDDGLASNAIAQIIQDDYGYLWLATWNGLSRFDGYSFYNYKTGNASHIPNLHNRIAHTTIDLQQNIWMRMYDGRVFVLNRQADRFINPFENVSGSDEYRVSCNLFTMSNGDVLSAIDGVGMYRMKLDKGEPDMQFITTVQLKVNCIAEGYHDDIWVGTDKGLHRIDIGNMSVERSGLFEDEEITSLYSNGYNIYVGCKSGAIYLYSYGQEPRQLRNATGMALLRIFVDSHDIIWFVDTRYGASRYIPSTHDEKHFEQRVLVPEYDGQGGEFCETLGTVWMLMNHGGYGYYNRAEDNVEYFHNDPSNPWNLSNTVYANLELPEGVVFLSTSRRGLEKLELLKNNISRTLLVPNAVSSIENEIRGMLFDNRRNLLLMGNKNNTLFLIRPDSTRTEVTNDSKGQPLGRIYGIAQDSKGNYWLSSKDYGLFKMSIEGSSYNIQNYRHDDNDKYSMSSSAAYQSVEDKAGNIWVATYGGGVNVLTRNKEGREVLLNFKNEMRKYPRNSYMKVRTIALAKDGKIWAGTTDGILIMELKNHKLSIERLGNSEEQPEQILQSTDVVCLARDRHGDMWVGTNGGGLAHAIGTDSKGVWLFESFGSKDGLPSEEIKSIAFDLDNNVWFATDHVLCSYNISKRIFTTFSNLDGVDETMCSEGAAITMSNGNILIGTVNGYYTIDRKNLITNNGSILKLRITDFYMNDELVSPRMNDYYDFYVPDAKSVELPKYNAAFAFRFAAMNYQLQHRIHYQYMLEGYDMEWRNADKTRLASYAGIPSGTYRFKVKAFLLESPEKYDMRTIEIRVPPFFLLSKNAVWLYMALFLIAALTLLFWHERRLQRLQQQMKVLKLGPQEIAFARQEDYNFVKSQLDWLEANLSNPNLKVDDMMEQAGMNREDYTAQMKELLGQTPKEFISDFRLKKAIMYLENTNDSINDIAARTGFADAVAFSRLFKSKMDTTPSKYREQKQQESQQNKENTENEEKTDDYELVE